MAIFPKFFLGFVCAIININAMDSSTAETEKVELPAEIIQEHLQNDPLKSYFLQRGVDVSQWAVPEDSNELHRHVVINLREKFGTELGGRAVTSRIEANGWIPPQPKQSSFFQDYKTSLIVAAIAGAIVVGWTAYELISAYKKVSQDEWDKTQSWSEKLALVSSKSNLTKLLNRLR